MKTHQKIKDIIEEYLSRYFVAESPNLQLASLRDGDLAYGGALKFANAIGKPPIEIAQEVADALKGNEEFTAVAVMPGYVNISFTQDYVVSEMKKLADSKYELDEDLTKKKIMVEYTDPNTFKVFHIGHLMTNAIGEALVRLFEFGGNKVVRANYQGDVGRHIAQAIYGILYSDIKRPSNDAPLKEKTKYLGDCYVYGAKAYAESEETQAKVKEINYQIYHGGNQEVTNWNFKGREWSLERFEEIYKILGTRFDHYFFESETAPIGLEKVKEHIPHVFIESEGATIFKGEDHGLHTRVFINKEGLPTYESKDVGLAFLKHEKEPDLDISITVTANEQADYFRVMKKAVECIDPDIARPMMHIYHGMMSGPGGKKMSSRTGDVVTGESLLEDVTLRAREVIDEHYKNRKTSLEKDTIAQAVAVAAIKFTILKQDSSKNIVFDLDRALSFEGDSGPYLLYTHARLSSILRKSNSVGVRILMNLFRGNTNLQDDVAELERTLIQFPFVASHAVETMEPHKITTYALELSRAINSWYASHKVNGSGSYEKYRLSVVRSAKQTLKTCIELIGMTAVEEM